MNRFADDDEYDIRFRRGRVSPNPFYVDPRIPVSPRVPVSPRAAYYHDRVDYLVPETTVGRRSRSHSRTRPSAPAPPPPAAPVIINNRIYNDFDDEDNDRYLHQLSPPVRHRARSRSRASSNGSHSSRGSRGSRVRDEYELERTRRELETYKLEQQRSEEERRYKKELELQTLREDRRAEEEKRRLKREADEAVERFKLQKLRDEKKAEEEKKRIKKEAEEAVEKFKKDEAERVAKEKKAKEAADKEYRKRLEEDMRKSGMDEKAITAVLNKEKLVAPAPAPRPTYTRMSRRHLSIETLNRFRVDYEFDNDPDYVIIKRLVPEYEQDFLWNHTREIRERRQRVIERPVLVAIEGKKSHHHHEPEFEFVREKKKKHERKPSPSPLLQYLAGSKR
ncbi:hypothetical protein PVAG01_07206 [Phlyctema vagabunda]|uniref:DUF8035 domain-containing protein n=1 Tax=Phlyctema vagabunda TaxID=108571 RepID=A0ABR4PBS7_9HELO